MKTRSFSILLMVTIVTLLTAAMVPCAPAMAISNLTGKIVFTASEGSGQIYLMNPADGSGLVNLSNNSYSEGLPQLSHDGTRVVYNRSEYHNPNYVVTNYIMNVDGSEIPLVLGYTNSNSTYPVWSPDDSKIAYVHHNASSQDDNIYTTTINGSNTVQITNLEGYTITSITWGSNHQIAFQAKESGPHIVGDTSKPWQIWCIDDTAVNESPTLLIDNPSVLYFDPEYSPDGTKIAFTYCSNVGQGNSGLTKDLGITSLSNPYNTINVFNGATTADPSWSPDGTALAFTIGSGTVDWDGRVNEGKIHRINIDKTDRVNLSTRWGSPSWPIWDTAPMWGTEPHAISFQITGASDSTVGETYSFKVYAKGNTGDTVTDCTGTLHFTSTDSSAVLPPDYTFTSSDHGVHSFNATFNTTGPQSITVNDTYFTGSTGIKSLTVNYVYTSIGLVSSGNPSIVGDSITFSATVNPVPDGGAVDFTVDGIIAGSSAAVDTATGIAVSDPIPFTAAGTYQVGAYYGGTDTFGDSYSEITQMVGKEADTATVIVSGGGASADLSDGVSTTITGSSLPDGTDMTISSVYYGGNQPSGTGSILLNGAEYYDVRIDPAVDGTAHISLTSASVTLYTVIQYSWYGIWYDAANNEVTGPDSGTGWYTVSGDIPVEFLSGTPIAIGEYYARTWFLDSETKLGPEPGSGPDTRIDLPPGFYEMEKANGPDNDGQGGAVDVNNSLAITWISDQQAEANVNLSGIWTFNLATSDMWACHMTLGEWDGVSTFSPFYSTNTEPDDDGIIHFTVDIYAAVVPNGHYLALMLDYSGSTGEILTDGQSYIVSPISDPGFPVPELPSFILLAIGLAGIGGFLLIRRKRIARGNA
jgi:Tol biopolymer transport system component